MAEHGRAWQSAGKAGAQGRAGKHKEYEKYLETAKRTISGVSWTLVVSLGLCLQGSDVQRVLFLYEFSKLHKVVTDYRGLRFCACFRSRPVSPLSLSSGWHDKNV
jgi:hypothetical protein